MAREFTAGQQITGLNGVVYEVFIVDEILRSSCINGVHDTQKIKQVQLYNKKSGKFLDRKVFTDSQGEYVNYGTGAGRDKTLTKIIRS